MYILMCVLGTHLLQRFYMKSGPFFLIYLTLLAYFGLFGSLNSPSDDFKIKSDVDDSKCLIYSSKQDSHSSNVVLEELSFRGTDFLAPSNKVNRYRIIRKPVFCIRPLINLLNMTFLPHFPRSDFRQTEVAARLPIFPLRI